MDYFKQTVKYLFVYDRGKRFLLLSLFAIVPCAIVAFLFPSGKLIAWFANFSAVESGFGVFWLSFFRLRLSTLLWGGIAFVLIIAVIAAMSTTLARHVRVGRFSLPNLFIAVNENFLPAIHISFFSLILLALAHTVLCLFLYLWSMVKIFMLSLVLSAIFTIGIIAGTLYFCATLTLWLPIMCYNGLPIFRAMSSAFYKSRSHQKHFFTFQLLCVTLLVALSIVSYFTRAVWYVSWIVTAVAYLFVFLLEVTGCFITYFDVESITREDLAKYRSHRR